MHERIDWALFEEGMAAARTSSDPAGEATLEEVLEAGGPDFGLEGDRSWHLGYDHAVLLLRGR